LMQVWALSAGIYPDGQTMPMVSPLRKYGGILIMWQFSVFALSAKHQGLLRR
jgi:hypothetical protein